MANKVRAATSLLTTDPNSKNPWSLYFREHGSPSIEMVRTPALITLVRRSIPTHLRGLVWQVVSGSTSYSWAYPGQYEDYLARMDQAETLCKEEIEKDLRRTLPDKPEFHTETNLNNLRTVLTCYSLR